MNLRISEKRLLAISSGSDFGSHVFTENITISRDQDTCE